MKIYRTVNQEIEVEIDLTVDDIEVIYLGMEPDDLDTYLKQLNDVAIFLRGTPVKVQNQLSVAQAQAIAGALADLATEVLKNCNGGLGTGLEK